MAGMRSVRVGAVSPFPVAKIAGLLAIASMMTSTGFANGSSSLLPVFPSVERWDFTTEWVPILEDAARFSLQSGSLPHGHMDVAQLHPADCRVASTVRYDVDIGLGETSEASATFYDPPIQWSPLAGVATHGDSLWRDAVSPLGPSSSRPQLLQLPDSEATHGRLLAAPTATRARQHGPLAPADVPSTLDVAVPSGVRIWQEDSELGLHSAGSGVNGQELTDAKSGDEIRSVLVQGIRPKPMRGLRAKGVESIALREPVPIMDGRLVGETLPLQMDLVGEEIQVESPVDALPVQRKDPHANVGASKLHGADDRSWWELTADLESAWADPRVQAVQSIIEAAEKSTGIKATSLHKISARPVMMLSLAFDAHAEEPKLHDLPVREIKKAMSERGISFEAVGPEKGDLVMAARAGGMSAGGGTIRHRVEAVVEGNPGEISRGQPGFTVISIATRDPRETANAHEDHVAALRGVEADQIPQWWKPSSPTKDAAALPGKWSPHRASALQRSSYRLLTGSAALLHSLASLDLDQMNLTEISRLVAGAALLCAALIIGVLELYGRRPAALIEALPATRAVPVPAVGPAGSSAPPTSTGPTTPTSPGRPGGRVAFKSTVRVRRFIEDAAELHERRTYWRALSARNAANRRASKLQDLTLRIDHLDRALSSDSITLATWLAGLDAEFALPKFQSEGFSTVSDLLRANVGSEDLEVMGISDAELRARVMAALNRESVVP